MKDHIAYYQRLIEEDPSHIDARLRLASVWRELGDLDKSVEQFHQAAQLLATEGLVLEAMAACKAVFEMVPDHTKTQLFLARLYAQRPKRRVVEIIGESAPISVESDVITLESQDAVDELDDNDSDFVLLDSPADNLEDFLRTQELDIVRDEDVVASEDLTVSAAGRALKRAAATVATNENNASASTQTPEDSRAYSDEVTTRQIRSVGRKSNEPHFTGIADLLHESLRANLNIQDQASGQFTALTRSGADGQIIPSWTPPLLDLKVGDESVLVRDDATSIDENSFHDVPLFSRLSPAILSEALRRMELCRFETNEIIIETGQIQPSVFMILSGAVVVEQHGPNGSRQLDRLERGGFFGEFELLTGRKTTAQVRAIQPVIALNLHQQLLVDLADTDPSIWTVLWEFYHERLLANLLAQSSLFATLDEELRNQIGKQFRYGQVSAGSVIIRQGDPGAGLYLVLSGEVEVSHNTGDEISVLARLRDGDFFGTVSSLTGSPTTATVAASAATTLMFLPRKQLQDLVVGYPDVEKALMRLVKYRQIVVGKTDYADSDSVDGSSA